jgi:Protein of unknown function (DUF3592)
VTGASRFLTGGHRPILLVASGPAAHTGFMFARVRSWFDGAAWFVGLAVALFVFALLAALIGFQSPDSVLWTGQHVTGTEQNGVVYYRWQGQSYTLDASGYGSSKAVSVYLDPGNPSNAVLENVSDRVAAVLLVGVPVAGGVMLLVLGGTRNYRWARRNAKRAHEDPRVRARGQW